MKLRMSRSPLFAVVEVPRTGWKGEVVCFVEDWKEGKYALR